jgi:hypothetical protein
MQVLFLAARGVVLLAGVACVWLALASSMRTVILPRAVPSRLTRVVFLSLRNLYELRIRRGATYERRDQVMASYGPFSLLALLMTWLIIIAAGFIAVFWALGHDLYDAFQLSVSSIVTLGFAPPRDLATTVGVLLEALLGLVELALLITYLPTMYAAFQRREALVTKLEVRAGSPPSGVEMLKRFYRLHRVESLSAEVWQQWEGWFVDIEEVHTSLPALNFFRSPQPHRSWLTASGAVLDAASLYASVLDGEHDARADLCIRAGYLALRQISKFFRLGFNPDPGPGDPISIARQEFDAAYDELKEAGLQVRADREAAWQAFSGWRVNYDDVLVNLAVLVSAPYAPWSSDRGVLRRRPSPFRAMIGL